MATTSSNTTHARGLRESINRCHNHIPSSPISTTAAPYSSSPTHTSTITDTAPRNSSTKTKIKVAFDPLFFAPKDVKKKRKNSDSSPDLTEASSSRRESDDIDTRSKEEAGAERSYLGRRGCALGIHSFYKHRRLGGNLNIRATDLSNVFLRTFKSSSSGDIVGFPSRLSERTYAPPLTTTFVPATRNTSNPLLVVGDEEGSVSFIDGTARDHLTRQSRLTGYVEAHDNAIFDLKFSGDSKTFSTASADQEIRIWDTKTQAHMGTCHGHTGSIKALTWSHFSDSIFASASRDGSIRIWDTRTSCQKESAVMLTDNAPEIDPMLTIDKAHASPSEQRKRNSIGRSVTRSVTSIAYLQNEDSKLASAGSANGSVKLWDIRTASAKSSKSTKALSETPDMTDNNGRPHGVSHIVSDGQWLWTLCTNSIVYGYPANNLNVASRIQLSDSDLLCASFWVRMAISPDARYLSCGSKNGKVFSWDIANSKRAQVSQEKAVQFTHSGRAETSQQPASTEVGSLDWADNLLASCSDDMTVRFWRPQP